MTKQAKPTRLLNLMEAVGWNGWTNWTVVDEKAQNEHIIPFKKWLRQNIGYCPTPAVRAALTEYYLDGTSQTGSRWYQYKDMGVEALAALYAKEKER